MEAAPRPKPVKRNLFLYLSIGVDWCQSQQIDNSSRKQNGHDSNFAPLQSTIFDFDSSQIHLLLMAQTQFGGFSFHSRSICSVRIRMVVNVHYSFIDASHTRHLHMVSSNGRNLALINGSSANVFIVLRTQVSPSQHIDTE